jgi:DNA polymerase
VSDDTQRRSGEVAEIAGEALRHLAWLAATGVTELPAASLPEAPGPVEPAAPEAVLPVAAVHHAPARPLTGGAAPAEPRGAGADQPSGSSEKGCGGPRLAEIRAELGDCGRCKLAGGRTHLVFGVGNPAAELMFVGEGPGADEDQQGEPFVGRAGQLLTKMIEAMGFGREDVYIANVVKCRPPGNRNPEPDEIEACEPFLRAQIAAVRPKVIVALGKFAAQTLLRDTTPITRLRGGWRAYEGVQLMPTFHPAYLLRSPEEKKKAWEDLQLVMKELGKPLPRR